MCFPFEVWSYIFCQLPNNSPGQLSRVSQAWRDIAKATPQLWTEVHIRHPHQFTDPAGLSLRLKKPGQCPLSVVLKVPLEVPELGPNLALLHGHVRRIRVLYIDVAVPHIVDTILLSMAFSEGYPKAIQHHF